VLAVLLFVAFLKSSSSKRNLFNDLTRLNATMACPGSNSFVPKLTTAVHTVVLCILFTVHPQHKIYGKIRHSAAPQQNFAGKCTVMAYPKSIFAAEMF
jgi:hypothetical protein